MAIHFFEESVKSRLTGKRGLSAFLKDQLQACNPLWARVSIHYIFCNDEYLLSLNQQFLNHDTLTDIITFDLTEQPAALQSEIYISTERVAENAASLNMPYNTELHRVLFHGALHLCGFKDKTKSDKLTMRTLEDSWLSSYFNK